MVIIRRNVFESWGKPEHHHCSAELDAARNDMCNRDIKKVGNIVGGQIARRKHLSPKRNFSDITARNVTRKCNAIYRRGED